MTTRLDNARYARHVAMNVKPERVEEFVSVMRNSVFPRTRQCTGARRLYLLRSNQSSNDFVVLTLWDRKTDADDYAKSQIYAKNSDELLPLVTSDPILTEYGIEAHDLNVEDLPRPMDRKKAAEKESKKSSRKRKSKLKKGKRGR